MNNKSEFFINNDNNKYDSIFSPKELKEEIKLSIDEQTKIIQNRINVCNILHKKDRRLLVICGPCSINDVNSALEYATRLKNLALELQDKLYIIMRVYFEKPRTSIGWKGLINDPYMDNSCNIIDGLKIARELLLNINVMNVPIATEFLDIHIPSYLSDFVTWGSIGARTTESQIHRELVSGLSIPVGFKNNTDGNITVAINAISSAKISHNFLTINQFGNISISKTPGNKNCHIILRGGKRPNFYSKDIAECEWKMTLAGVLLSIIVDCSHGNSNKNHYFQENVVNEIITQIRDGNKSIVGIMLESYIHEGSQELHIPINYQNIKYGVSVTDACISWEDTEYILRKLYKELCIFSK